MRSFPPDVMIIDRDGVRSLRLLASGRRIHAESFTRAMFSEPCFDDSITPMLTRPEVFSEAIESIMRRRKLDGVSILLPDSWFRARIIAIDSWPDKTVRQREAVQWAMRKHSPSRPGESRLAWEVIEKNGDSVRLIVLEAADASLRKLEDALSSAGLSVVLIEPMAMNVWNALTMTTPDDESERVLVVAAHDDLTMIHCRGSRPDFIRARRVDSERASRDIRLAASYLRQNSGMGIPESCWIVGDQLTDEIVPALEQELDTRTIRPTPEELGIDTATLDGSASSYDLIAALGVFAA